MLLIQDTEVPIAKRSGALPALCASLKEIFVTPKWNQKLFKILEDKIISGKRQLADQEWIHVNYLFYHRFDCVKTSVMMSLITCQIMSIRRKR